MTFFLLRLAALDNLIKTTIINYYYLESVAVYARRRFVSSATQRQLPPRSK